MSDLKLIAFLAFFLTAGVASFGQHKHFTSQPGKHGHYSLVLYLSGGEGYFLSSKGIPDYLNTTPTKINPVTSVRVMWFPDHLIKVGLESGLITFYKYGFTDSAGNKGTVSLNATPILLVWSMSITKNFNIFAGSGAYILNTKLDYQTKVSAQKYSVGWMAAASYIYPVGKSTGLGLETKWLYAAETSNGSFIAQLQFVWKFLKWK
jgi:hypothetical protein